MKKKYEDNVKPYLELIAGWCRNGSTDKEIAKALKIGYSTFNKYKTLHQELVEALKSNKDIADTNVESALYSRAIGHKWTEQVLVGKGDKKKVLTIEKELPPDVTAQIFWLKNRKPKEWSDKKNIDHTSSDKSMSPKEPDPIDYDKLSISALKEIIEASKTKSS